MEYIKDRKFLKYLFIIFIAMTFHTTAILSLAIYFLYPLKWKINAAISFSMSMMALFVGPYVINVMVMLVPKYRGYISGEWKSGGSYLMLFLLVIIFVLQCWDSRNQSPKAYNKLMFDAMAMTILVQSLGYSLNIFGRAVGFYSVYLIFIIPNYIESINGKWRMIVKICIILCLFAMVFNDLNASRNYIEYATFWANV